MEFGPRALGNRSLLADPRRPDTSAILNRRVKHREDFRLFAPSVLAEQADDWFEVGPHLMSHEYMLLVAPGQSRSARPHSRRAPSRRAPRGWNWCAAPPTRLYHALDLALA